MRTDNVIFWIGNSYVIFNSYIYSSILTSDYIPKMTMLVVFSVVGLVAWAYMWACLTVWIEENFIPKLGFNDYIYDATTGDYELK